MELIIFLSIVFGISTIEATFKLTSAEIIRDDGYPVEQYTVTTPDGYELTMFRIPYSPKLNNEATKKPVAFLMHGFISSSDCWLLSSSDNALPYILSDAGYDVWLGNARGNTYSKVNKKFVGGPWNTKFWDFSWHEIAVIDLPAMIDYVLEKTEQTDMHYVGHSQGTTVYFVLMSSLPEYNNKIRTAHMLAPVAYMSNMESPFAIIAGVIGNIPIFNWINFEFLPTTEMLAAVGAAVCNEKRLFVNEICANTIFLLTGFDHENLNYTLLPKVTATQPAGSSIRQLIHFAQNYGSKGFNEYDYGLLKNRIKYGSTRPPAYNTSNIVAPTYLYYGDNDYLSSPIDVKEIAKQIQNVCALHHVPLPKWNHLNYLWAINVKAYINIPVRDRMLAYDNGTIHRDCNIN